ncbi:MAG: S-layer homology domain-containing protein [Clostridiales bacterium]|nr:S-layer homology domain-containing protein [Clostridiales bacterium]MCF8023378.1 S-layer homology domain-containing protein [Clostridiales bacterium]
MRRASFILLILLVFVGSGLAGAVKMQQENVKNTAEINSSKETGAVEELEHRDKEQDPPEISMEKNINNSTEDNTGQKNSTELYGEIKEEIPAGNTEQVCLVVSAVSNNEMKKVSKLVRDLGGEVQEGDNKKSSYLKIRLPRANLEKLAGSPLVLYVEEYKQPEFLNDRSKDITGARPLAVPGFINETGFTGKGQTLGVADSGLSTGSLGSLHPDLESSQGRKPRVIMLKSWAGVEKPADKIGHGTHMAAAMVGSGRASGGAYAGIAPGASLYFQGIVDEKGNLSPPLDLHELFQPAYEGGVRVHVDGWGRKQNTYNSTAAQIDEFVQEHPDFLPVFGAGNSGPDSGSLTSEANSKNALVIGASVNPRPAFENNPGSSSHTAAFSSHGPAEDGRIKPELVAPGKNIISASSSLVDEHLPGRPQYALMSGTSMASAAAGGAAAVLRQYLEEEKGVNEPSAALLKSMLINGARRTSSSTESAGFGVLDISSTVIALENDLFQLANKSLSTGEEFTCEKKVEHGDAPLKATLAWTDPAAAPGDRSALVNNLDLEVTAPGGEKYYGNDLGHNDDKDDRNNVEQVYIKNSAPGTYKIAVHCDYLNKGTSQDFALVYGQAPARGTVSSSADGEVTLSSGEKIELPEDTRLAVNNRLQQVDKALPAGTGVYLAGPVENPRSVYAAVRTGHETGVKTLSAGDKTVFVRINREYRQGGYMVDKRAQDVLSINGCPVKEDQPIPPGAAVTGYINPFEQALWKVNVTGAEISGVLTGIDREKKEIKLLDKEKTYSLSEETSISFSNKIEESDAANLPFGDSTAASMDNLLSGMPVNLIVGDSGKVYHISVKRHIALGRVVGLSPQKDEINLSTGSSYHVMQGASVVKNGSAAVQKDIGEGNLALLNLVPGSKEVLSINLYTDVIYGKVIFAGNNKLYMLGDKGKFYTFELNEAASVFRWGMPAGQSMISSGQWVRAAAGPESREVLRVDIAEEAGKTVETLESIIPSREIVKTAAGNTYHLSRVTKITKEGFPVKLRDLMPGETATVTALYGNNGQKIAASLDAGARDGVQPPTLKAVSTIPFEEFSMVKGNTGGDHLYAKYPGSELKKVNCNELGEFYHPVPVEKLEVQLVAVDSETGGVAGLYLNFPRRVERFTDIDEHWAEIDIQHLAERGMVNGYPDRTFRPDNAVTRVEFTVMLTRLMGESGSGGELPYKDKEEIPRWARGSVALAYSRDLAAGYSDNTFRPRQPISREEAAAFLVRAYDMLNGKPVLEPQAEKFKDMDEVSDWAKVNVNRARALGLLGGRGDGSFDPEENITRAETAAVINRLLSTLTEKGEPES